MSERLTYKDKKGKAHIICNQMCANANEDCTTSHDVDLCQRYVAFEKLADYEDLEEQGLLLKLPCKIGSEVYYILGVPQKTPCVVEKVSFELSDINKIGKTLFLTQSEAEEKLRELEGK